MIKFDEFNTKFRKDDKTWNSFIKATMQKDRITHNYIVKAAKQLNVTKPRRAVIKNSSFSPERSMGKVEPNVPVKRNPKYESLLR